MTLDYVDVAIAWAFGILPSENILKGNLKIGNLLIDVQSEIYKLLFGRGAAINMYIGIN